MDISIMKTTINHNFQYLQDIIIPITVIKILISLGLYLLQMRRMIASSTMPQ
ncbi:hypothetical protein HPG69_010167 [Diceros bicornis minor]|uniref:Uncharacterized protein n=1 Tax=Diceros bicornis minor TaxID=77932 RepID=A0A7J7EE22_DICBM|nr:hypothetical protein HPG69_010167 [Diceros bicornis minor]